MSPRRAPARRVVLAVTLALLSLAGVGRAQNAPDSVVAALPAAVGFVNDFAGVLEEPSRAKLEGFLDQLQKKTGVQFALLTVRSTAPLDPSEYKVRVFERWKLGTQGRDDGLLLLVAVEQHAVRFETGYGLEGTLPDGWQSRMVREEMLPRLKQGDYDGAITRGVLASAARIAAEKGVRLEWDGSELRYGARGGGRGIPGQLLALIVFLIVMTVLRGAGGRGYRRRGGWWIGPLGGGLGGGFGGFGGGGGGGGFGGGSFGGFGGGSSGGGGGGGNW